MTTVALRPRRLRAVTSPRARAHLPFLGLTLAAIMLRVVATLGYPSVFWFGDSSGYLTRGLEPAPSSLRPAGYSLLLWMLKPFHSFTVVVAVQHALGLLTGVLVYAAIWNVGRRAGRAAGLVGALATMVAAPCLLDVHQLALEQLLMSDTLFTFLIIAALSLPLCFASLPWWAGFPLGLILGAATVTRTLGLAVAAVMVAWLLVRRAGIRLVASTLAALALVLAAYAGWYHSAHGRFALTGSNGVFLYNRTAAFADCGTIKPPTHLLRLCRDNAAHQSAIAPGFYVLWSKDSPFRHIGGGIGGARANELAGEFARAAIKAQPGDYMRVVAKDVLRGFTWHRGTYPTRGTVNSYRFPGKMKIPREAQRQAAAYAPGHARPHPVQPYATWLRAYQHVAAWPGIFIAVALLIGLVGVIRHWRGAVTLPWTAAMALLIGPPAVADFDYRYLLPVVPLSLLAAALTWMERRPTIP
jgi:hypothetical protein